MRSSGGTALPLICFPMREHQWRMAVPFAGDRDPVPPDPWPRSSGSSTSGRLSTGYCSDPTWLANFNCHRRSTKSTGAVMCCWPETRCTSAPLPGGQGMNTGITDAHNLGWKLALVAAGRVARLPPRHLWRRT